MYVEIRMGKKKTIKGWVVEEYDKFYLINTIKGYNECVDKHSLLNGESEVVKQIL